MIASTYTSPAKATVSKSPTHLPLSWTLKMLVGTPRPLRGDTGMKNSNNINQIQLRYFPWANCPKAHEHAITLRAWKGRGHSGGGLGLSSITPLASQEGCESTTPSPTDLICSLYWQSHVCISSALPAFQTAVSLALCLSPRRLGLAPDVCPPPLPAAVAPFLPL